MIRSTAWMLLCLLCMPCLRGQEQTSKQEQAQPQEHSSLTSGGTLIPEQACFDVQHYDLSIEVLPESRTIRGSLVMTARATGDASRVVLDLHEALSIQAVSRDGRPVPYARDGGRFAMDLDPAPADGETFRLKVDYGGQPRPAPNAPWDGGFSWSTTPGGAPWIATSCQMNGADLWWPCKDHPSDKPESFDLHVTVPRPLVCASNGRLVGSEEVGDDRTTWHWHVSTPIQNYGVALNIAPYQTVQRRIPSVAGDEYDVIFWHLPSSAEKAPAFLDEIVEHLAFFEKFCGPYPFRIDKYGVAETPHLGMEHQSIIGYGNKFRPDSYGYDWLHHHELSHEWWANLVTCKDWNDFWIHEGFGTYCQVLYTEQLDGPEAYHRRMAENGRRISNRRPVAPREIQDTRASYGDDVYFKGCWVLHTLRYVLGDEAFFRAFRRMAYPDPAMEKVRDGSQLRFATTDEFQQICEKESGQELGWFFELYLRQADLPRLETEEADGVLSLRWKTPGNLPFPMPVEVQLGERTVKVAMEDGAGTLPLDGASWRVDPHHWILRKLEPRRGR